MDRIGRYEIIAELGRGAMGIVYKARDTKIGREVAIKTIRLVDQAAPSETSSLKDRLFREAQSAGRLSHPGIVTIYDIAEEAGLAYITMEFVAGRTLESLMQTGHAGDAEFIADFLQQTAAALDYAHGKEIVHRDIKPANMMITPEGGVKITDFGIARIASSQLTQTGTVMGTPSYMSPEQVRGDAVDGRSDQFSLGVIAYELLTGKKPFVAESLTSVIFKIVTSEPVPPRELRADISPELERAVLKALSKPPADRYATCRELARNIEAACGGLSSPAATPSPERPVAGEATVLASTELTVASPATKQESAYGKTQPVATAPGTKLPPLTSKGVGRLEEDTTARVRRERRRAWPWVAALLLICGAGAGWFYLGRPLGPLGPLVMGDGPSQESLTPPDPGPEVFEAKVNEPQASAAAAPAAVVVTFQSSQPGARVVVDGEQETACTTPCSMDLPPGQHQAVASLPEFLDEPLGFEAGPDPLDVTFTMRPVPPTPVRFTSNHRGARVTVDGGRGGSCTMPCSLNLQRGAHQAVASAPNVHEAARGFEVGPDAVAVTFELSSLPPVPVQFTSEPAGARVVVDGRPQWACTTPCSLELPRGKHEYLASQQGFRPVRGAMEATGEPLKIAIGLERIVGTLALSSNPSGADVYVDGRKQPDKTSARLSLAPGYHLIRVESGSRVSERSVLMREGEFRTMHFVLGATGALRSTLSVRSTPPGASIVLNDNTPSGQTPRELSLPAGSYRVTLSLPGHRPVIREVELAPNEPTVVEETLSRQD